MSLRVVDGRLRKLNLRIRQLPDDGSSFNSVLYESDGSEQIFRVYAKPRGSDWDGSNEDSGDNSKDNSDASVE